MKNRSVLQGMSGPPLFGLTGHGEQRLQVVETEYGRREQWPFSPTFCQVLASIVPHCSVVAGRLDKLLVAILFALHRSHGQMRWCIDLIRTRV